MLSPYHQQFLHELHRFDVRYIVVGGQARRLCAGSHGFDLDIWVEYSEANRDPIIRAFGTWARDHPMHVADPSFADRLATALHNGIQCNFPATTDVVLYMDGDRMLPVTSDDGVNLLIGNKDELDFAGYLDRAIWVTVGDLQVPCICPDDDSRLARLELLRGPLGI